MKAPITPYSSFELYYNDGGHGGPHPDLAMAIAYARRLIAGSRHCTVIEIRPRNSAEIGGFGENHRHSIYVQRDDNNS